MSLRAQYRTEIKRKTEVSFACNNWTHVDLFKAMNVAISPWQGYWGDENGKPYTDPSVYPFAQGNLFHAHRDTVTTGNTYKFYFWFTSPVEYCGQSAGDRFELDIMVVKSKCFNANPYGLGGSYAFCYDDNHEKMWNKRIDPKTMEELLFTTALNPAHWYKDSANTSLGWLDLTVFSDSLYTNPIGNNLFTFKTQGDTYPISATGYNSTSHYDTVYVEIIERDGTPARLMVDITVFRQSTLTITYTPDIKNPLNRYNEYDIEDDVTISVDRESFDYFKYYLNNKYLNEYFMGGDTTKSEVTLNALTFTGLDDIIKIVATDNNGCFAQATDNVVVNVPFPNIFTPDGDGINDVFLGGEKYRNREFHLEIFNRWGNRIYYGENGWDGVYQGKEVAPGDYFYAVRIKNPYGEERLIKGSVTVVRKAR
jgi:gliding motility-associated-like protein